MNIISAKDAYEYARKKDVLFIDVRTPLEFNEVHAKGALNVPLDVVDHLKKEIETTKKEVYVLCKSGNRAQMACEKFSQVKNSHIHVVEGGTLAWLQHDLSVVRGKKSWDLERQVRAIAGFLVLSGVLLGVFVHSSFLFLAGFVGFGLLFAALTNTCTMGLLLSKLPFNKSKSFSLDALRKKLS